MGEKSFRGIDIEIETGEVLTVIGPSGSRIYFSQMFKSPRKIDEGTIYLDGNRITGDDISKDKVRRQMGMVFQSFNLFPHKTVLENVLLAPMKVKGLKHKDIKDKDKHVGEDGIRR